MLESGELHGIWAFALVTLFETLNPGPTLGLVIALAALQAPRVALSAVVGIGIANATWAALVFFAFMLGVVTGVAGSIIHLLAAGYLVYLASGRIILSMVRFIAYPRLLSTQEAKKVVQRGDAFGALVAGFTAHALNPLTPPYYLGTFYAATLGALRETVICGVIAVLSDVVIYSLVVGVVWLAKTKVSEVLTIEEYPRFGIFMQLLAGMAFLYLVAHVFSATKSDSRIAINAITTMVMFLGFFTAVMHEVYRFVSGRAGLDNKALWRLVALWGAWFSVAAVGGGILALYQSLGSENVPLDPSVEHRLRMCLVVAATLATACAFAKAFGELRDEQVKAGAGNAVVLTTWHSIPLLAALAVLALLASVYVVLWVTDFSVAQSASHPTESAPS